MWGLRTGGRSSVVRRHIIRTQNTSRETQAPEASSSPLELSRAQPSMSRVPQKLPEPIPPDPQPSPPTTALGLLRPLFRPGLLICLAIGVCVCAFGRKWLGMLPDLSKRDEYRITAADVQVTPPPRWVPENFVSQALESGGLPREMSLLDDTLVRRVAESFRRHPWVADVVLVKKSAADGVAVELKYRQPVAMVAVPEGFYPVDAQGILLPPGDLSAADARRFPLIQNVTSRPAGSAGANWGDPAVLGAAKLAAVLQESPSGRDAGWKRFQLAAIRLGRSSGSATSLDDTILELATEGGSRIIWGRPPGTGHPGELTVEQKIGRLDRYVHDYGGFDQPHGPYEIDIRHWQEISRRSLASGDRRSRH